MSAVDVITRVLEWLRHAMAETIVIPDNDVDRIENMFCITQISLSFYHSLQIVHFFSRLYLSLGDFAWHEGVSKGLVICITVLMI